MITNEPGKGLMGDGSGGPTDYSRIRIDMIDAMRRYVFDHLPPGGFLTAVLENDLKGAVRAADSDNMRLLAAWVSLLYNEVPSVCYGNRETVTAWLAERIKVVQP